MDTSSRRQRCHVKMSCVTTTAMLLSSVLMAAMVTGVSSMLFASRTRQTETDCPPWLTPTILQDLTAGMGNMSHMFDYLLPSVLIPRVSGSRGNAVVREFIKQEMSSLGWYVEEDSFVDNTPYGVIPFSNVIATFNPLASKRIVVACHYDSKYVPGRTPFLGATDSAVPCSLMIDTARKLNQMAVDANNEGLSAFTLQFIFFDGEEAFVRWSSYDSIYGSRHLASLWQNSPDRTDPRAANNLDNIDFFVLLDLIGTTDTRFVDYYSNTSSLFARLVDIEQCMTSQDLMVRPYTRLIFDPRGRAELVEDDHIPFIRKGVRVLHLISTPFPRVWHTVHDNLQNLNPELIDDFSRIFRIFLASLLLGY